MYEWDAVKVEAHVAKHSVRFELVYDFDQDTVIEREDDREDYGEIRMIALGFIKRRLYVLVYTERENVVRVISLRRAGKREVKAYYEAQT